MSDINGFGIVVVIFLIIPNAIYIYKKGGLEDKYTNGYVNILESIGRYGSIFFMVFNLGIFGFEFQSTLYLEIWIIISAILLAIYWISWKFYLESPNILNSMVLAIVPGIIFVVSGFMTYNWVLLVLGTIFLFSHSYITYKDGTMV